MTHPAEQPAPPLVAHLGPDPADGGGMPEALRRVLASRLATTHLLRVIPTHRTGSLPARLAVFARALGALAAFCLGCGPRIVHIHATVRGSMYRKVLCVALAKALGRPVVLHVHAGAAELALLHDRVAAPTRAAFGWAFRHADRVLAVSSATARVAEAQFGAGSATVLPNAAPDPVPAGEPIARAAGEAEILYLGGFADPVKGADVLLAAVPEILRRTPGALLSLAGPGTPPAGATDRPGVRWLGWLDEAGKREALGRAEIFVLPSTSEGLPMTLLEAMAHGRAIVATRVGGVPDVVTDGVEGLLIAPSDPDALATALAELVADADRRRTLGAAAQARASALGADAVADRLAALYQELLAS